MDVVIVGSGTFGASLAWWLARADERVTLVDQFEPGDRRASSGGETRLYRCAHGPDGEYTTMARRARTLWRELEQESGEDVLLECGLAWFAHRQDGWEAESARTLAAQGIPAERLDVMTAAGLYPSLRGDDLAFVLLEPEGGVLRAERAIRALAAQAARHGARMVRGRARPDGSGAVLGDSTRLQGDIVVWACGPWLADLFPDFVSLTVTCQQLLFFDGGPAWRAAGVPSWCDYDRARYGTADIDALGVKAALDDEGPPLDPDAELPDEATTEPEVRAYLRDRFPALEHAPLVAARSCRYEITTDTHFIAAPHPSHPNVCLVGGGSGHGFKHGPPMAERLAQAFRDGRAMPTAFGLGKRERAAACAPRAPASPPERPKVAGHPLAVACSASTSATSARYTAAPRGVEVVAPRRVTTRDGPKRAIVEPIYPAARVSVLASAWIAPRSSGVRETPAPPREASISAAVGPTPARDEEQQHHRRRQR